MEGKTDLQKYIHLSKYSKYLDKENRRETWNETVDRYINFWLENDSVNDKISMKDFEDIRDHIYNFKTMPSMRALMTAGKALRRDNLAGYNCAFINISHPRCFDEIFFLSLCAAGVGFSVAREHITKLPEVAEEFHESDTTLVIRDSKIGWAAGLKELISMLYQGSIPKIDTSKVRPAGARLKTFGGRASGPEPLVALFNQIINIFRNSSGRKLQSIECHDICCHILSSVIVGGVRRSAAISLSNLTDDRMRRAKDGQWWLTQEQRALANNSVAYTEKPDLDSFSKEWRTLHKSKSGERGIINMIAMAQKAEECGRDVSMGVGINPCVTGDMIVHVMIDNEHFNMSVKDIVTLFENGKKIKILSKTFYMDDINELNDITYATKTRIDAEILKITDTKTGKFIKVTPDHLVYTKNRGYVKAEKLKEDDILEII